MNRIVSLAALAAALPLALALADVMPIKPARAKPVTVAKPAADATLAGAADLKVFVAAEADELDDVAAAIAKEVAEAKTRKAHTRIAIYADTTTDYGCDCPPFVFAPFYNSGRDDSYVLPLFAKGVPDAPPSKVGLYRFAGHFDGRRITGFEWMKARGEKVKKDRKEGMEEYAKEAPVFVVDGWCFEPAPSFADEAQAEIYDETLRKMAKSGRFCAGSSYPSIE